MINLLCCLLFLFSDHPICLNAEFQLDIQWWHDFCTSWHGVSFWLFSGMLAPSDVELTSDAAGALGLEPISIQTGLVAHGCPHRHINPLPISNFSP